MTTLKRTHLTAAELHVMLYIALGFTQKETATQVGIKQPTVRSHMGNAFEVLRVNNAMMAVKEAGLWGMSDTDLLICVAKLNNGATLADVNFIIQMNRNKNPR